MDIFGWTFLCSEKMLQNKCIIELVVLLLVCCIILYHLLSFLICEWVLKMTLKMTKQMWFNKNINKICAVNAGNYLQNISLDKNVQWTFLKVP